MTGAENDTSTGVCADTGNDANDSGDDAAAAVDPNTFSLFYSDAGGQSLAFADDPCLAVCTLESWPNREVVYDGTPWVGDSGPEEGVGRLGTSTVRGRGSALVWTNTDRGQIHHAGQTAAGDLLDALCGGARRVGRRGLRNQPVARADGLYPAL